MTVVIQIVLSHSYTEKDNLYPLIQHLQINIHNLLCMNVLADELCAHIIWMIFLHEGIFKGPLNYKYILTSVDVYESIHHKIITC